jgi:hypothetical protein
VTGYSFVSQEQVEDFILKLVYVQKRKMHIIAWTFIFYKPHDRWILNAMRFNDEIDRLF